MQEIYDVAIIGGGPAGSTSACLLAQAGRRVIVLERDKFPRFHIGESLLPRNYALFRELDLLDLLEGLPKVDKYGAEFILGSGGEASLFPFTMSLVPGEPMSFNLERAPFDARRSAR